MLRRHSEPPIDTCGCDDGPVSELSYPPEPWYLGGSLLVSVFLVPATSLPPEFALPQGRRPFRLGGRVVVGVAAAQYVPGGVLDYDELLIAVPSLGRGGLRITIPQIWVDSPTSLSGGRALWGIPKQLARFTRQRDLSGRTLVRMTLGDDETAALRATRTGALLPGMRQLALPILQTLDGRTTLSHNRVIGRVAGLRAAWKFSSAGPLGYLAGRRPLLSIALHDASIIFGMRVQRSAPVGSAS